MSVSETELSWTGRLVELNLFLPAVAAPAGSYVPAVRAGNLVFTAGQLPFIDGKLPVVGKVGDSVTAEQAKNAAATAALNALAAVDSLVGIDTVVQIVKATVFVASAPGFTDQPYVANGASDLLGTIFQGWGAHVRSAVGVAELPLQSPVEVELTVQVLPESDSDGEDDELT
jgi:enamine deaminase RidA (YjgF/YER057c/UK114 family)